MKTRFLITIVALCATLAACGDNVPQDTIDTNMGVARSNAQKSADVFLRTIYPPETVDARLGKPLQILMDSDSTIGPACRFGDGWASGVINFDSGKKIKVYCQTNGTGKGINGCLTEADFVTKAYKDEDKVCNVQIVKLDKR